MEVQSKKMFFFGGGIWCALSWLLTDSKKYAHNQELWH